MAKLNELQDNAIARQKNITLRIFCAELLGTALFIYFGCSTMAQVAIGKFAEQHAPKSVRTFDYGNYFTICFGWGLALTIAVLASGRVSGTHLNPAVSVTTVVFRQIPATVLPVYLIAQILGAFIGVGFVYTIHGSTLEKLARADIDVSIVYFTSPLDRRNYNFGHVIWDQLVGSAIYTFIYFSMSDEKSKLMVKPLRSAVIGSSYGLLLLGTSINAGAALNPIRDIVPRIFAYFGANQTDAFEVFMFVPLIVPFFGCLLGGLIYQMGIGSLWPETQPDEMRSG